MTDYIEMLTAFGLSRQEAKIYILLLTNGQATGYEVAKKSGISRSNVYTALAGLVEKGAALVAEEQAVLYQPVPVKEFADNHIRNLSSIATTLVEQMPKEKRTTDNYITIRGTCHVKNKFHHMLLDTEYRMYLSASVRIVLSFREEIKELLAAGKKVVILTDDKKVIEKEFVGAVIYQRILKDEQIRLITDSAYALTGRMVEEEEANCLFSSNPNLVQLLKDALANEIELIKMNKETIESEE